MDLRIVLGVVGVLIIIGLIIADRIKGENGEKRPYRSFSADEDLDLPSMSTTHKDADPGAMSITDRVEPALTDQPGGVELSGAGGIGNGDREPVDANAAGEIDPSNSINGSAGATDRVNESEQRAEQEDGMVLSLLLLASDGERFRGSQLKMALKEGGLSYGKMEIFHLLDGDEALVSVADVIEPGTFNFDEMSALKTPGVVIFSQLPSVKSGAEIFTAWRLVARKLNIALGGHLCSINRMPLEDDFFDRLKAQVEQFDAIDRAPAQ